MNLTKHFTLEEMVKSPTANTDHIDNTPTAEITENLKMLCINVLEVIRDLVKESLHVSSGYRCLTLNTAIGGVNIPGHLSQHTEGKAADIEAEGYTPEQLFKLIEDSGIRFDQLIWEPSWVHISWNGEHNRHEKLRATKIGKKTIYTSL